MSSRLGRLFDAVVGGPKNLAKIGDLDKLATDQLLALMRHEAHRIEKTIYNQILEKKYDTYREKWERIQRIHEILAERGVPADEPTVAWSREIVECFDDLQHRFIEPNSKPPRPFEPENVGEFVELVKARRSVRVWADEQPEPEQLHALARQLIDAARWAPTSGNRQPWRFKILIDDADKQLLSVLKENHCITAPLLVFIGMDTRVYGALGREERSIYIDAGAAATQMVLAAHSAGYGVCWNHFADDLVLSRKANIQAYEEFADALGIPSHVTPVAIVAVGRPEFLPPVPARTPIDSLLL